MNSKADELYVKLQEMYEFMKETGDTQDIEAAIFDYEDCTTDEDYENWLQQYSYFC